MLNKSFFLTNYQVISVWKSRSIDYYFFPLGFFGEMQESLPNVWLYRAGSPKPSIIFPSCIFGAMLPVESVPEGRISARLTQLRFLDYGGDYWPQNSPFFEWIKEQAGFSIVTQKLNLPSSSIRIAKGTSIGHSRYSTPYPFSGGYLRSQKMSDGNGFPWTVCEWSSKQNLWFSFDGRFFFYIQMYAAQSGNYHTFIYVSLAANCLECLEDMWVFSPVNSSFQCMTYYKRLSYPSRWQGVLKTGFENMFPLPSGHNR